MKNLAARVRSARRAYGESQRSFAPRLGISQQLLCDIENGYTPSIAAVTLLFRHVEREAKEYRAEQRAKKSLDGTRR